MLGYNQKREQYENDFIGKYSGLTSLGKSEMITDLYIERDKLNFLLKKYPEIVKESLGIEYSFSNMENEFVNKSRNYPYKPEEIYPKYSISDNIFNANISFKNKGIGYLSDGSIFVCGAFNIVTSIRSDNVLKINIDGTINRNFAANVANKLINSTVNCFIEQPDGKLIIAGNFTTFGEVTGASKITRLNSDGTYDTTFNVGGKGFNTGVVEDIALQPDGKIIAVGTFTQYNGVGANRIVRLNPDGTRDTGFTIGTGLNSTTYCVLYDTDINKIYVGGRFTQYNSVAVNYLVRLNLDGTRDTSFVVPTITTTSGTRQIWSILKDYNNNNKIFISGLFKTYSGVTTNTTNVCSCIRINSDASLDTTFNKFYNTNYYGVVNMYKFNNTYVFCVPTTNGFKKFDLNFNEDTNFNPQNLLPDSVDYNSEKQEYIASTNFYLNNRRVLFRMTSSGITDTNWTGIKTKNLLNNLYTKTNDVYTAEKDYLKTFISGTTFFNQNINSLITNRIIDIRETIQIYNYVINKYDVINKSNKSLLTKTTLNTNTKHSIFNCGNGFSDNSKIHILYEEKNEDKIYVGGWLKKYNFIDAYTLVIIDSKGKLLKNYKSFFDSSSNAIYALGLQSDGKKIFVGDFYYSETGDIYQQLIGSLMRLNKDNTFDYTFICDGGVYYDIDNDNWSGMIFTIKVLPDDKILIGGEFSRYGKLTSSNIHFKNNLMRLNSDGTFDNTFNPNNIGMSNVYNTVHHINTHNNKILVCLYGESIYNEQPVKSLFRLNWDGTIDNTFNAEITNNYIYYVGIHEDKYYVNDSNYFVRLNYDGSLDNTFEKFPIEIDDIRKITFDENYMYVIGKMTSVNNVANNNCFKYNLKTKEISNIVQYQQNNWRFNDFIRLKSGNFLFGGEFSFITDDIEYVNGVALTYPNGIFHNKGYPFMPGLY